MTLTEQFSLNLHNYKKNVITDYILTLNGNVNKQNIGTGVNKKNHLQRPDKLKVRAVILGHVLFHSLILQDNLTDEIYLDMLGNSMDTLVVDE